LAQQAVGDAQYGFSLIFPEPVAMAEREALIVRPVGSQAALAFVPDPVTSFALLSFVAMDIVNNCNLRCPFCLFDYAETKTTRLMPEEVFDSALRLLPHARDAGFWLSCLHEPSLHPGFLRLIERIPRQWRHKVMFTTNLAERMPEAYFAALAESGVFHINISLESTTPAIYEKFRQGARWPIFKENWDRLIRAWQEAAAPPRLRYIIMAYRSNLAELPELVRYLREARLAWQVELRCTMEMSHIPAGFAAGEYLGDADWNWLETQLAGYSSSEVLIVRPIPPPQEVLAPEGDVLPAAAPQVDPAAPPALPELPLNMLVEWDGSILVCNKWERPSERKRLAVARIQEIADPCGFLLELAHTPVPAYLPDRRYGPLVQGYIDALSAEHVSGWIRDAQAPEEKIAFEIVIEDGEATRVVAQGVADALYGGLAQAPFDDHEHGFDVVLGAPLSVEERERLVVRDVATRTAIKRAPHLEVQRKEAVLF
jgi:Radical SAM superfamily